jgi:hypothetical protein
MVELLVVMVIMPLIVGAITAAVITSLHDQSGVSVRLSDSASARTTSAFYVRDVQSATFVTTVQNPPAAPAQCGSGSNFVLGLTWGSPAAGSNVVSYWANLVGTAPTQTVSLVRQYCAVGSSTPLSTVNVAEGLAPTSGFSVAVTPSSQQSSASSNWTSTAGTSSIAIAALQTASTFNFNLVAVPRIYTPQSQGVRGGGNPHTPALLLLGTGTPALSCSGSSTARMNVTGTAWINSTANNSIQMGSNAQLTATQLYAANLTPNAVIQPAGSKVTPSPPAYQQADPDPYGPSPGLNLQPPSTNGLPVYSDGNYHGPGVYSTTLTFSGQGTTTLATGTYILQQGISVSGQASLANAPGGVFLYVSGGSISFSGQGIISLSPPTPPYTDSNGTQAPNLGIWQASTDTNTVNLSGNGAADTYSGVIYAPGATVTGTGNGGYTAGSIISKSFACGGNGTANIGG